VCVCVWEKESEIELTKEGVCVKEREWDRVNERGRVCEKESEIELVKERLWVREWEWDS